MPIQNRCMICGYGFVPGLKNPNVCGSCYKRIVARQRIKAGLTPTPNIDKKNYLQHIKDRNKYMEWVKEEMKSDNFGKKVREKVKFNRDRPA